MWDFLLITGLVFLVTIWLKSNPFSWKGKGIKWSIPLPIFGNTGKLLYKSWPTFWQEFYSSLGTDKIHGFHYFLTPALIIKDPQLLKKILITDADHFLEREIGAGNTDPIGRSIFFTKGLTWKKHRSKMTPYFTPSKIKATLPYISPIADKFVQYITQESRKGPVDVHSTSLKLSTDVIMSNAFGLEPDCFVNPDSFFYNLQREIVTFKGALCATINILSPKLFNLLDLTIFDTEIIKKITRFVTDVIYQRSKGIGVRPDFIQGMIELMDKPLTEEEIKYNEENNILEFNKKTVVGQCLLMYSAGTETTGNTLTFLLYEIAFQQNIQDKLREEIKNMIATTSGQYDMEHLHKLSYTNQVLNETLRKYPIVVAVGRKCTTKYNLDGLEIPVGTIISIPIIALHRDPNIFPDPMKFDPERFSSESDIIPGTYLPFGLGPRTCIGMKFAQTEILLALCKLIPKYKILPCDQTPVPVPFTKNPTISPSVPMWLEFQPIET